MASCFASLTGFGARSSELVGRKAAAGALLTPPSLACCTTARSPAFVSSSATAAGAGELGLLALTGANALELMESDAKAPITSTATNAKPPNARTVGDRPDFSPPPPADAPPPAAREMPNRAALSAAPNAAVSFAASDTVLITSVFSAANSGASGVPIKATTTARCGFAPSNWAKTGP